MDQEDAGVTGFADLIDLASERLGGRAIVASDEFFGAKENLLKPEKAVFVAGKFTEHGKWMDGWESRRKRGPGHDWCIIALGRPGAIEGVNVDTSHFNGNQPETCTVEGAETPAHPEADAALLTGSGVAWTTIVDHTPLEPDSEHLITAKPETIGRRFTHVRLNIFPDGGVARFRVHGSVLPDWPAIAAGRTAIDLASAVLGGLVIACNDMHFGSRHNMIMPGRGANMGDGWETRRKRGLRGGEHDWAVIRLGHRGLVEQIEVDTNHFKGNFPESCQVEVCDAKEPQRGTGGRPVGPAFDPDAQDWRVVLPRTKLRASEQRLYQKELDRAVASEPCTHARIKIFPDGGISRLRLYGRPVL
jgi:allantoicase